ncbi:MAG: biotin/lipoyl-containing protein [Desulfurococcaceae archaeon]|nr:hypothetical protein [Sulfolobales archaeon]MDW8169731.1 biotin/lipoyl-containing protein [Desulfurococcaceae archaeon]
MESTIALKAPRFDPSVEKVIVVEWKKKEGEIVKKDEALVEMLGEKTTFTHVSPCDGVLKKIIVFEGEVSVGSIIGEVECYE